MTKFEDINADLEDIKAKVKKGYISPTLLSHFAIYSRYIYYRNLGNKNRISILLTSENCRISEPLIYQIIKEMESEL